MHTWSLSFSTEEEQCKKKEERMKYTVDVGEGEHAECLVSVSVYEKCGVKGEMEWKVQFACYVSWVASHSIQIYLPYSRQMVLFL